MSKVTTNKHLRDLFDFLSIPSISAQSSHKKDMKKASEWLKNKLNSVGLTAKIMKTKGHPIVYAENLKAGKDKPTILIYGHYDVQDPGELSEWRSDPFKPVIRNGNIYARGSSDDKGQLYTWIAALAEMTGSNPVNIKFLIEGEEEVGSININKFVKENKSLLKSDICVISDSHCLSEDQPMIDYGLRGLVYIELKIRTMEKDVHSGIYGGNILNPANILSGLITKMKNKDHKVKIPGFYENVRKLSNKERTKLNKLPFTENGVLKETGIQKVVGEKGFTVHERAGARPTLDVNGIWGGYTGEGPKTIIPSEAHAKISMRLVPNQKPKNVFKNFKKFIKEEIPKYVDYEINLLSTGEPILMNPESQYFKSAEKAYKKVFGKKPLYELSGGSIPVTATFQKELGIDSILMGHGLPDDNLHSPNEKLSLTMFKKGIKTNIEFLIDL